MEEWRKEEEWSGPRKEWTARSGPRKDPRSIFDELAAEAKKAGRKLDLTASAAVAPTPKRALEVSRGQNRIPFTGDEEEQQASKSRKTVAPPDPPPQPPPPQQPPQQQPQPPRPPADKCEECGQSTSPAHGQSHCGCRSAEIRQQYADQLDRDTGLLYVDERNDEGESERRKTEDGKHLALLDIPNARRKTVNKVQAHFGLEVAQLRAEGYPAQYSDGVREDPKFHGTPAVDQIIEGDLNLVDDRAKMLCGGGGCKKVLLGFSQKTVRNCVYPTRHAHPGTRGGPSATIDEICLAGTIMDAIDHIVIHHWGAILANGGRFGVFEVGPEGDGAYKHLYKCGKIWKLPQGMVLMVGPGSGPQLVRSGGSTGGSTSRMLYRFRVVGTDHARHGNDWDDEIHGAKFEAPLTEHREQCMVNGRLLPAEMLLRCSALPKNKGTAVAEPCKAAKDDATLLAWQSMVASTLEDVRSDVKSRQDMQTRFSAALFRRGESAWNPPAAKQNQQRQKLKVRQQKLTQLVQRQQKEIKQKEKEIKQKEKEIKQQKEKEIKIKQRKEIKQQKEKEIKIKQQKEIKQQKRQLSQLQQKIPNQRSRRGDGSKKRGEINSQLINWECHKMSDGKKFFQHSASGATEWGLPTIDWVPPVCALAKSATPSQPDDSCRVEPLADEDGL